MNFSHESESIGGSLYWNSGSGMCYSGQNNATINCDFTTTGLKEEAKNMIGNSVWYLGSGNNSLKINDLYAYERSTKVHDGYGINWTGKIGIVYPSDYGYATSGGITIDRNACLNSEVSRWSDECKNSNWLSKDEDQWTITSVDYENTDFVYYIYSNDSNGGMNYYGTVSLDWVGVYPTVYLKSNVRLVSGDGSSTSPYVLSF